MQDERQRTPAGVRSASPRATVALACVAVAAISLLPVAPLLYHGGLPLTHEGWRYPVLFDHFREAFLNGQWYPRWLPDLNSGYGYPTFVFYQPAYFFAVLPFSAVTDDPLLLMFSALTLLSLVGGVGTYLLCREWCDRPTSLFCTALFALTPYLYVNLYVRGDLSELMSMFLTPWPLFFLSRLRARGSGRRARWSTASLGVGVSVAILIFAHPIPALVYLPILVTFALVMGRGLGRPERWRFWRETACALALGLLLSAPYWFTVLEMRKYVTLDLAFRGYLDATTHVVHPYQFFSRYWDYGVSVPNSAQDEISFQLGLPHFVLAALGVVFGWRRATVRVAFVCYAVLLVVMTPLGKPVWRLPLFGMVQFPWRLLAVTAILQVVCCSGLQHLRLPGRAKAAGMTAVLLLACGWYGPQFTVAMWRNPSRTHYSRQFLLVDRTGSLMDLTSPRDIGRLTLSSGEFAPKTSLRAPMTQARGHGPLVVMPSGGRAEALPANTTFRIAYRVTAEGPASVIINQFYLPGWRVLVDGRDVPRAVLEAQLCPDGRIQFQAPAGTHEIRAYYDGPPGWPWRNLVIVFGVLAYAVHALWPRLRAPRGQAPPQD